MPRSRNWVIGAIVLVLLLLLGCGDGGEDDAERPTGQSGAVERPAEIVERQAQTNGDAAEREAEEARVERLREVRAERLRERRQEARAERRARARRRAARERREAEEREQRAAAEAVAAQEAEAEAEAETEAATGCDPSYDPCVPPSPPDLNCPDLDGPYDVSGSDPHGLDGDDDGVGCE